MKKVVQYLLLLVLTGMLLSFSYVNHLLTEVLKTLDIAEERAKEYVVENMENERGIYVPSTSAAIAIPEGKRAEIINKLGDFIKAYVNSDDFKKRYQEKRNTWKLKSWEALLDERVKKELVDIDEALEEAPAIIAKASPAMRPMYERQLKEVKESKEALMDPKHPKHAKYRKEVEEQLSKDEDKEEYLKSYNAMYALREKRMPGDINLLLRSRLQEFLRETANMPWEAKLEKRKGVLFFADPELEKKDLGWKKRFRAGKTAIEAARAYAQAWLKSLPAK